MPEITQEEKIRIFEKLPKELKDLMESENTGAFLLYIGEKYGLDDDKTSLLSKTVGDIVLGITPLANLVSEIISKLAASQDIAYQIAQEINAELFAPFISIMKDAVTSTTPAQMSPTPKAATLLTPAPIPASPLIPSSKLQAPSSDQYREPTMGPEIVDLRKTPLATISPALPMADKVEPPVVSKIEPLVASKIEPPAVNKVEPLLPIQMPVAIAPIPPRPAPPLTFTRPIERPNEPVSIPHYIEADPHKTPESITTPKVEPSAAPKPMTPLTFIKPIEKAKESVEITEEERKPQFIFRPPGLPPTDLPHDVLDLRRDKGEF